METPNMAKKQSALEKLDDNGELSPTKRIELLLWGDKELGILGLKGRMDRVERIGLIGMVLLVFILLVTIADLQLTGSSSLLELLLTGLLGI